MKTPKDIKTLGTYAFKGFNNNLTLPFARLGKGY